MPGLLSALAQFRDSLRRANLSEAQIEALAANAELAACTFFLQQVTPDATAAALGPLWDSSSCPLSVLQLSEQVKEIVLSIGAHRKEQARILHKASHNYVLLFERMVTEFVRLSKRRSAGGERLRFSCSMCIPSANPG